MIITVGTTDVNLLNELKVNYPDKYKFIMDKTSPVEKIGIMNYHDSISIHVDKDIAVINDGKKIEFRTGRIFGFNDFKRLHAIGEGVNDNIEIDFLHSCTAADRGF